MTLEESLLRLGLPSVITDRWIRQLGEPHRHYHTLPHVQAMLEHLPPADETLEMIAAIWLHDIIYDPHSGSNEELSADQAKADLRDRPDIDAGQVAALVRGTKLHEPGDHTQDILNDLDLGIFGTHRQTYANYARQIRQEYSFVPDDVYAPNRALILSRFDQHKIYRTPNFAHLEGQAHENLRWEIAELAG